MQIEPRFGGYYVFPVQGSREEMQAEDRRISEVIRGRNVAGRHGCFGLEEISLGEDHFLVKKTYDFKDDKVRQALEASGIRFDFFQSWEDARASLVETALMPRIHEVVNRALPGNPGQIEFLKGLKALAGKLEKLSD